MVRIMLLAALLCGCDKDEAPGGDTGDKSAGSAKEAPVKDSAARGALVEAWKKAGLTTTEMKDAKAFGKDCKATTVNNVEVVVCDLGSADEAKKAEPAGLTWVGGTTGAAWVSGNLVIAVADRKKADVNGKTINALMKSTPKL